ncbi:MAG: hypothetical protein PHD03_04880 [Bacilli bacterium]|nr:hypothetical protein [Bacilli bacterium]MDD4734397.1 hypothetical protein [Bacilli bacterium]
MSKLNSKIFENKINLIKKNMTFGIEIEGNYNMDKVAFDQNDIESYHSGGEFYILDFFKVENDSSIKGYFFDNNAGVEVITKPIEYNDINVLFSKLKELLNIKDYMGGSIQFNSSTGAHMHISLNNTHFIKKICDYKVSKEIETEIFKFLENYSFAYSEVKNNFFRDYAKKLTPNNVEQRYVSINTSGNNNPTIEIRSINFNGVISLIQMYFLVKNVLDIMAYVLAKYMIKNSISKTQTLYIEKNITTNKTIKEQIIIK